MAAEDIEKKVRKMSSQKPEDGKDLQQLQEAQNQIVQINAERQGNLQMARLENNANAANNETMSQAVEMASLGGLGGAAVQQQVQAMNPQTQAVLGKYGLGQPKVQRTSSRSVQVTPQKITINNNTTNTTTNNVAVPAANIGGPVQGRTLAIKQDESQARFKTWISNAFAKQNQQAAVREKEYQRREWSLTRSTNKLMKHLSDLGKSVSERLNPQKLASSVGNQFKTILFLFGTTFLAKNWEKVIEYGAKIENFLFGARGEGINGERGKSGLSKMLISAFGGDPNNEKSTVLNSLKDLFYTGDKNRAGVFDIILEKVKHFFEIRGEAVKTLKVPTIDPKNMGESLQRIIGYLGDIFKVMLSGPGATRDAITSEMRRDGKIDSLNSETGRKGSNDDRKIVEDELGSNRKEVHQGDTGTLILSNRNFLTGREFNKEGLLKTDATSVISQARDITRHISNASNTGEINTSAVISGYNQLKSAAERSESGRIPVEKTWLISQLRRGQDNSRLKNLINSNDIITKRYKFIIRPRTKDELYNKDRYSALAEGLMRDEALDEVGAGWLGKYGADLAGHQQSDMTKAWAVTGRFLFGGKIKNLIDANRSQEMLDELKEHEILDLVPEDASMEDGWHSPKSKDLKDKVFEFYEVTPKVIDEAVRNFTENDNATASDSSLETVQSVQARLINSAKKYGKEITYVGSENLEERIKSLNDLESKEKELKQEQEEQWKNSNVKKSIDNISEGVSSAVDSARDYLGLERKYPSLTKDQGEFIRKMREAYSKKFKELGIDEKYIDALVAQDAIESGWGTSDLATKSNNFGGLKNGNKGWQKFNSLEDYINSKVDLLRNENGYYKNAFNCDDIDTMMNRVASVYDPKNNKYAGTWKDVYNSVSRYNPLSTEEIKSLRNQGKYTEADLASSSWEKIEDILRAGGVTDFIAGKTKREAGEAGNSGNNSYHTTENLALDIVPTDGNFERLKQQMLSSPLIQEYFKKRGLGVLDETTDEMLKKTGGTGYHFHIGPDRSSVDTWLAWNKEFNSNNSNEGGVYYADNYVEEKKPESNYLSQLVLDEKSYNPEFSMPSFNSPFLASTSFTTPNSATKVPTIDTPMISAKTIGKEITSSNNDSATISDILKTTNLLNDNIKLLQQGQLAQVQATTSIASGLGNMTITVNSGGDKKIPTAGWTKEPYA